MSFFESGQIMGWQGFIALNGSVYNWMGAGGSPNVTQTSLEYTSSKSTFTFDVDGKITMVVTFLSPVYPNDLLRQSQQYSYVSTKVKSADGASHDVQIYMDISGGMSHKPPNTLFNAICCQQPDRSPEWTSGDPNQVIKWDTGVLNNVSYHKITRGNESVFEETNDVASWGTWYLATRSSGDVSCGAPARKGETPER
jgi:hypothetical protein